MVRLLDFIKRNGIDTNLWDAYYGNCGQSWHDLYGSGCKDEIKKDHITIWWHAQSMDDDMLKWMTENADRLTLNSDGEIMFHFFIN